MAIDTADKRRSSTTCLMPFYPASVSIDGSMSQADRQEAAWGYSGILAGAVAALVEVGLFDLEDKYGFADLGDKYSLRDLGDKYIFIDPDE
jgi:hypothetical protein